MNSTFCRLSGLLLLFTLLSIGILHRSLSYSFHYDDYSKLLFNPAMNSLRTATRGLYDRNVQSIGGELNTHMYRPLFGIEMAIEKHFFGDHPGGYRVINLILHGINAGLVALIAFHLFGLGLAGCLVSGLIFLLHPAQTESVVWIVEKSSLFAGTCMLSALALWITPKNKMTALRAIGIMAFFIAGLLFKESAAALPFVIAILATSDSMRSENKKSTWSFIAVLFVILAAYLLVRHHILGRISNIWMENFSLRGYLAPILIGMAMALKFLLFPNDTTINHQPWPAPANEVVLFILAVLVPITLVMVAFWAAVRLKNKPALCFCVMVALWLPTSQIIPIKGIFAERFLYFVLIPFAWMIGLLYSALPSRFRSLITIYVVTLAVLTSSALPIWRNDGTLWDNALRENPSYWNSWIQAAEWEKASAMLSRLRGEPEPAGWRERAEEKYINGLKAGFPTSEGAGIFLRLSEINFQQGKWKEAEQHGQRAVALRPELENDYENLRRKYVDGPKS